MLASDLARDPSRYPFLGKGGSSTEDLFARATKVLNAVSDFGCGKADGSDDAAKINAGLAGLGGLGVTGYVALSLPAIAIPYNIETPIIIPIGVYFVGHGTQGTSLKLADGANCSVFKTVDFDTLTGTNAWFVSEGVPFQFGLFNLFIDANASNNTTPNSCVQIFGKHYILDNIYAVNADDYGIWSECGAQSGQVTLYTDEPTAWLDRIVTRYCGKDGFHFEGPHDAHIGSVVSSVCGWRNIYITSGANSSGGCDIDFLHAYGSGVSQADGSTFIAAYPSIAFGCPVRADHIIGESAGSNGVLFETAAAKSQVTMIQAYQNSFFASPGLTEATSWPVAAGTGYVPGNTITLTGGTFSTAAIMTVQSTRVISATITAGGSGGTDGNQVVTGTTGTGTKFTAEVTVAGGIITAIIQIVLQGLYTVNPTTITAEPVTGGAVTGATLNLTMGVAVAYLTTNGVYTVYPTNPVAQGSTSGSGTGATFNVQKGYPSVSVLAQNVEVAQIRVDDTWDGGGVYVGGNFFSCPQLRVYGAGAATNRTVGLDVQSAGNRIDGIVTNFNGVGGTGLRTNNRGFKTANKLGLYLSGNRYGWVNCGAGWNNTYRVTGQVPVTGTGVRFAGVGPTIGQSEDWSEVYLQTDAFSNTRYGYHSRIVTNGVDMNVTTVQTFTVNHLMLDGLRPWIGSVKMEIIYPTGSAADYAVDYMTVTSITDTQITFKVKLGTAKGAASLASLAVTYGVGGG